MGKGREWADGVYARLSQMWLDGEILLGWTIRFEWTGYEKMKELFEPSEVHGLDKELVAMLMMAHGISNKEISLDTNGKEDWVTYRLTATVSTDGHSPNSEHYKALAVDIGLGHLPAGAERDRIRWYILKGLYGANFKRIEDCPLHIHAGVGKPPDYVSPCAWIGEDS